MNRLKTFLTVIGAVTILVLAANSVAYAATGGKFVLGKVNKARTVSTLKRTTNGPALNLVTKPTGTAPFSVNSNGKVTNLNADSLDGLDSSAFAPATKAPIATGYVLAGAGGTSPSLVHQSGPATTVAWDAGNGWYALTMSGVSYFYQDYLTVVTSSCDNGLSTSVGSVSGKALVMFGTDVPTCAAGFAYAVYKLT